MRSDPIKIVLFLALRSISSSNEEWHQSSILNRNEKETNFFLSRDLLDVNVQPFTFSWFFSKEVDTRKQIFVRACYILNHHLIKLSSSKSDPCVSHITYLVLEELFEQGYRVFSWRLVTIKKFLHQATFTDGAHVAQDYCNRFLKSFKVRNIVLRYLLILENILVSKGQCVPF